MLRACAVEDVRPGKAFAVTLDGIDLLVCNVRGVFHCVENVCTHDGAPLDQGELEDCRITCPRHGAVFDVTTGTALRLPAILPLPVYPAVVRDRDVFVELPA